MKKYKVSEALDDLGAAAEVVPAAEAGPDAAYVRMYQFARDRLHSGAVRGAEDLANKVARLSQGLHSYPGRSYADDFRGIAADAARIAQQLGGYEALREVQAITTTPED